MKNSQKAMHYQFLSPITIKQNLQEERSLTKGFFILVSFQKLINLLYALLIFWLLQHDLQCTY